VIYVCVYDSVTPRTVKIEADRMRRMVDGSEWHFYRRTKNLIFHRWVMVGKVENSALLSIHTESGELDRDFLKQAGVRM